MELKVKFLPSLLQCTAIYVYALQVRAKKKKSFIILQPIKIIFVCFFFLFFYSPTMQVSDKTLSTLLTPSNSLFQTLTYLSRYRRPDSILNVTGPPKLNDTNPPTNPLRRTPNPIHALDLCLRSVADPHLRPISTFSDAFNSLKLTLSNSHLSIPSPLPPIHATNPTRLQVSCLCHLHLHAQDF